MKPIAMYLAGLLLPLTLAVPATARAGDFDEAHRFVFYAVLEGCFQDGLSTNDVAQILMRRDHEMYFRFIYSCPLCTPTIQALEVYRDRPQHFYGVKSGASTFGAGLAPDLKRRLYSDKTEDRLTAINLLVQRWIKRRMDQMGFTDTEKAQLQKALEEKRKEGMKALKGFQANHAASTYAPAFADGDECAVCNAAVGMNLRLREPK